MRKRGAGLRHAVPKHQPRPFAGYSPARARSASRNDQERAMHAQIADGARAMFDSGLPSLNATRAALGLAPLEHLLDQFHAARAELLATARAFDFPCSDLPDRVR